MIDDWYIWCFMVIVVALAWRMIKLKEMQLKHEGIIKKPKKKVNKK